MAEKFDLKNLARMDIRNLLKIRPDLTPKNQRILGFLLLAIGVVISFTWLIIPTNSKVVKLNQELKSQRLQIETLKTQASTMKMDSERLDKLRDRLNVLVGVPKKKAEFNLDDYTTFSVLKSIVRMAVKSGCVVEEVRPQPTSQVSQPSSSSPSISLRKKVVLMSVRGEYPAIKQFIGRLVDFPGLVSIEEARLEREVSDSQGEYVAGEFQIVIYGINY